MKKENKIQGLEGIVRQKNKKDYIQNIILQTVVSAGLISVALVAPKVLTAMKKLGIPLHLRQREIIGASKGRLIKKGFLEFQNGKLKITKKGHMHFVATTLYEKSKNINKKWDGKW